MSLASLMQHMKPRPWSRHSKVARQDPITRPPRSAQLPSHRPFDVGANGIFTLQSSLVGNTVSLTVRVDFAGVIIVAKVQVGPEVPPEVPPELVKASLVRKMRVTFGEELGCRRPEYLCRTGWFTLRRGRISSCRRRITDPMFGRPCPKMSPKDARLES